MMKVIFFGTPTFAAYVLERLIKEGVQIVAVVTQPDKQKGRSQQLQPLPVKAWLNQRHPEIPCFQPEKVSTPEMEQLLRGFDSDIFLVLGYGEILKEFILNIPKVDCINIHTSLLPKYRGAAPIQRAIMAGESTIGVTIMRMVKKMDAGEIFAKKGQIFTEKDNFEVIEKTLMKVAADLICKVLPLIYSKKIIPTPQDESEVTFAPKISLEDYSINWDHPAKEILNQIRAFSKTPGTMCKVKIKNEEKYLKIYSATFVEQSSIPREIFSQTKNSFCIGCGKNSLELHEVKLEGKSETTFDSLLRGYPHIQFL